MKRNVEPSDVGWALAGILTLCVYGALLWFVWHKKKLQPELGALPVAPVPPLPERFEAGSGDAPATLVHPLRERADTSNETTIHPDELRKLRAIEQSYEVERARKIQKALENMKLPLPVVTDHSSVAYANWDMVKFQTDKNLISFGVPGEEIAAANEAATARIKSGALFCTLGPDDAAHFSSPAEKRDGIFNMPALTLA